MYLSKMNNILIKVLALVLVACMLFSLVSCNLLLSGLEFETSGIENFRPATSTVGTTTCIIPEKFLDDFKYENAQYYYNDECPAFDFHIDRGIIICEYDDEVYTEAKNYCLDNMELFHDTAIEYNGYTFIENVEVFEHEDCPNNFNMFVYNDDRQCLIFLGFYFFNINDKYTPHEYAPDDFIEILETYFTDYGYYDFSE